jgi:hypothetical protein
MRLFFLLFFAVQVIRQSSSFSAIPYSSRFRSVCPASLESIQKFDASLLADDDNQTKDTTWAAVFRNKPVVKDDFLHSMRIATSNDSAPLSSTSTNQMIENRSSMEETPVAVARLTASDEGDMILDTMRCVLQKERMNAECDGGSEHTEALGVAIDSLLLHYLQTSCSASIRCKATLVAAPLLEARGFQPVNRLQKEMVTHTFALDAALEGYAKRVVTGNERALTICGLLGQVGDQPDSPKPDQEEDDYDPWAGVKQFL